MQLTEEQLAVVAATRDNGDLCVLARAGTVSRGAQVTIAGVVSVATTPGALLMRLDTKPELLDLNSTKPTEAKSPDRAASHGR